MFTSFHIENFRCFRRIDVEPLNRVNLIAGKNNVGKTALLEAIQVHCHPFRPTLWLNVSKVRGIEEPSRDLRDVASWLFIERDMTAIADVSSHDSSGVDRTTSIRLVEMALSQREHPEVEEEIKRGFRADIAGADVPRLILKYDDSRGGKNTSVSFPTSSGISSIERLAPLVPTILLGADGKSAGTDVENFSSLERAKGLEPIVGILMMLDERLTNLSLLSYAGQSLIHADVGLPHLIPVPLLGDGVRRLLSIALAIFSRAGGVVLVDEIENGLHHSVLSDVWSAIGEAARMADAQVFATTHSWECIRAAHEAFSEKGPYDFTLHRLDRENGEITTVAYDREMIETALISGLEMR